MRRGEVSNKGVQGRWLPHYCGSHRPWTPYWILHPVSVTNKHTAKLHQVGSLYILTYDVRKLKHKMRQLMLTRVCQELEYLIDVCRVTRGAHIEHLQLSKKKLFQFSCGCEKFH